jgi:hypothetical protein
VIRLDEFRIVVTKGEPNPGDVREVWYYQIEARDAGGSYEMQCEGVETNRINAYGQALNFLHSSMFVGLCFCGLVG